MIRHSRNLAEFLERYALLRDVAPTTLATMGMAIRSLEVFLNRTPQIDDLERETMLAWLAWRKQLVSPSTVYGNRRDLLSLAGCAFEEDLLAAKLERIPTIKIPKVDPEAWPQVEFQAILAACNQLPGLLKNGIPRAKFYRAFALVDYSTGLRLSAALALRRDALESDGSIIAHWSSQKHRHSQRVWLNEPALAAVEALGEHEFLLPWGQSKKSLWAGWKQILKLADVRYIPWKTGPQKIRRTASSHIEAEQPGASTPFLGHRSADLAKKHYNDPRIVRGKPFVPPRID